MIINEATGSTVQYLGNVLEGQPKRTIKGLENKKGNQLLGINSQPTPRR